VVEDAACWVPSDFAGKEAEMCLEFTAAHIEELDAALEALGDAPMQSITKADVSLPSLSSALTQQLDQLEHGRGFFILKGLPVVRWGPEKSRIALWAIGTHLGWAEKQDAAGSLIHDVKDHATNKSAQTNLEEAMAANKNIRGFQTNAALPFHTDGCDMFALMCLSKGRAGGKTSIVSAVKIFNDIVQDQPDLAEVLQQPFHFDARGQRADGAQCQVHPIYCYHEGRLNIIHKAPYIFSAQKYEDVPKLTELQKEAIQRFEQLTEDPSYMLAVELQPGECVVCSNHSLVHGRTAFEDGEDSVTTRHMLRLWLTNPNGRPLPPHYADTREHADGFQRRML